MFGLFKSKKESSLTTFADLVKVDFHSHLIPGVDDGAKTIEDSVSMVRKIVDLGFEKIITTPHIMSDYYRNTPEIILGGLDKLRSALKENGITVPVEAAAEYYFDENFEQKLNDGNVLTFGDKHLLFELSFITAPPNLVSVVQKIKDLGYKPILAHPERYPYMKFEEYENLKSWGCYFQLNTISLTGYYNKSTQKRAEELVDKGWIDFIGSDMHHHRHADALARSLKEPYLEKLIIDQGVQNRILL